jgi:PAS domain S-box-containing protein
LSNSQLFTERLKLQTVGTARFPSTFDGRELLIAYRQIPDLAIVVTVANTVDTILAPWRRNAVFIGSGVAGALVVLLALLWLTLRQIERRSADARRLLEAEEQYRTLVEHAPIGIAQHANGIVEYANPEFARIYGAVAPGELLGRQVIELVHPDDRERLRARLARANEADVSGAPFVFCIRRNDGTEVLVESHAVSTLQGDRWVEQVLVRDVTEARRAAEQVRQLNETLEEKVRTRTAELEAANEELESFSYSVSHDLQAPLRAIAGYSGIVRTEHAALVPGEARALIGRIEAAAKRMSELIEDLLSLARVSRQEIRKTRVDLSRLAREIGGDLAEAHPGRAVDLRITPGLHAYADPLLLRIVLQNLLANAWKYTSKRAQARVEFGVEMRDGERVYYVRDNGAGFDMQHSAGLFKPFQRLHTDREYEGTGIGLATVERIIRRHSGRIWADAAPDGGATFSFVLPESPATLSPAAVRKEDSVTLRSV